MRQVSIKDIAREAQVSHPTVSRALRNSPLVNAETAERIRRVADDLGYRPNAVARGLVTKKTMTVGAVVTSIANPFTSEVIAGIEAVANDQGYSVILANSKADPEREIRVVQMLQERRVDGILVISSRVGVLYMSMLSQLRVPIVLINNQHPEGYAQSVMFDNVAASQEAVEHLIRLGHRRIAYLGNQNGYQSDTERFAGYRRALQLADYPFHPELVVHGDSQSEGGRQAMARLLALHFPPTAVFCYNDVSAIGALCELHSRRLRVPEDVSLVGFDDISMASYTYPPLTTVRQPKEQMGRQAMEILLGLFSQDQEKTQIRLKGELIVRDSTAPPRLPGRALLTLVDGIPSQ